MNTWKGQVGEEDGFCVMDTPLDGLRLLAYQLLVDERRHGRATVRAICSSWAPPNENDTEAYVAGVAKRIGLDPDAFLDFSVSGVLEATMGAVVVQEDGSDPYPSALISAAADEARAAVPQ